MKKVVVLILVCMFVSVGSAVAGASCKDIKWPLVQLMSLNEQANIGVAKLNNIEAEALRCILIRQTQNAFADGGYAGYTKCKEDQKSMTTQAILEGALPDNPLIFKNIVTFEKWLSPKVPMNKWISLEEEKEIGMPKLSVSEVESLRKFFITNYMLAFTSGMKNGCELLMVEKNKDHSGHEDHSGHGSSPALQEK